MKDNFNLNKYLILSGIVGPIIFFLTIYFAFSLIVPGYDIKTQYISEFGAVDSPIKTIANVFGFSLFGIFIMIFAYGVYRSKLSNLGKLSSIFIFITGISMFLVGIFPCDAQCNNFSFRGDLHNKASNYQFPILAIGYIFLFFESMKNEKIKYLSIPIIILGPLSLILGGISILTQGPLPYHGLIQRAAIGTPYILMIIVAIGLYKGNKNI